MEFQEAQDTVSSQEVTHVAYIRPMSTGFAVCSEDGTQLAVFDSREAAYFTARQHNLDPVNIH